MLLKSSIVVNYMFLHTLHFEKDKKRLLMEEENSLMVPVT